MDQISARFTALLKLRAQLDWLETTSGPSIVAAMQSPNERQHFVSGLTDVAVHISAVLPHCSTRKLIALLNKCTQRTGSVWISSKTSTELAI